MPQLESFQAQAETCVTEADVHERAGESELLLTSLRKAVLLLAAADADAGAPDEAGPLTLPRARTCRRFADALAAAGRHADAASAYQEATDLYGLLPGHEARKIVEDCARHVIQSVKATWDQPGERLYLMIARHERRQQLLALRPGTEAKQADCFMHVARIFQRRDRPTEAVQRYTEALRLLDHAEPAQQSGLARAECHHRIATLLAVPLQSPIDAVFHYRLAIGLYAAHEPAVYSFQQSKELCAAAMARLEAELPCESHGVDSQRSYE